MAKSLEPYRRAPGTVDAGADFARQLERRTATPPFGEVIKDAHIPSDGAFHYIRHHLGRPFQLALIGNYHIYRDGVFTCSPEQVRRQGYDPAKYFSAFGHSATGDNIVTFWVI